MAAALNRNISIKEVSSGPLLPPLISLDAGLKAGVSACNAAGQAAFRALLQMIVQELVSGAPTHSKNSDANAKIVSMFSGVGEEGVGAAKAAVGATLAACVRGGKEEADALGAVSAMGFSQPLAKDLVDVALGKRDALQGVLGRDVPKSTGLGRLRWRLDVAISSSSLAKVMRTVLLMEVTTTGGKIVTFEVPPDKFAELRYGVAKALQEAGTIEAHPVLRI